MHGAWVGGSMAGGHCVGSSLAEELGSMQGQGARHTTLRARGTGSVGDGVGPGLHHRLLTLCPAP